MLWRQEMIQTKSQTQQCDLKTAQTDEKVKDGVSWLISNILGAQMSAEHTKH